MKGANKKVHADDIFFSNKKNVEIYTELHSLAITKNQSFNKKESKLREYAKHFSEYHWKMSLYVSVIDR